MDANRCSVLDDILSKIGHLYLSRNKPQAKEMILNNSPTYAFSYDDYMREYSSLKYIPWDTSDNAVPYSVKHVQMLQELNNQ
jgi:hypothetical protein